MMKLNKALKRRVLKVAGVARGTFEVRDFPANRLARVEVLVDNLVAARVNIDYHANTIKLAA